ncbi:PucR family transcriptional regulator [Smaragdicoccus niigatensis]|uniref:PucR family transcriptional regulator n=1 Tax=Smaragdicoccus niigatensis TaxID=359359 RepID=UPI00058C5509|nr:helix-turn-helix domain-containing protein [Smaragdicoccus niigatensis]
MSELIRAIAGRMLANEDEIVQAMDSAVIALVPVFGADAAIMAEASASNRGNLRRFVTVAQHADSPPPVDVPPEALDIARTLVRRGIEFDAIFQGYRAGQQVAWQRWLEAATEVVGSGPEFAAVLEASLALLFKYVDDVLSRVLAEAQHEREEILGGALARRAETVRLILDHAPIDERAASNRLGYELRRRHTAVVLWAEVRVPQGALESAAELLAQAAGGRRPLTLVAGTSTLWAWIGTEADPTAAALRAAFAKAPKNIRAAVGPTERGIVGFRRSHDAAVGVHRLLAGQSEGEHFATYAELEVTALAAHDERRAAEFIKATLGPLAADEPNAARLRESLRVFLDEADNAPRAAIRLHTHRNTVLQRIARATELLGHEIGERRLALALALELAHRLGPRVLVRSA